MRSSFLQLGLGALLALGSVGCNDYLTGTNLNGDPNDPTPADATIGQLFVAAQTSLTSQMTGELARAACMYVQQCAGTDRQYQAIGTYVVDASVFAGSFDRFYTGGGLTDLRNIQQKALAATTPDSIYLGVAKVMEAYMIGTAADLWGDIPYSEALNPVTHPTPHYDGQMTVYTALQAVLDDAIKALNGSTGNGPGPNDLVYAGSKTKWLQLAHLLKARYYLHTAEANGAAAYTSALSEAQQGISSAANDYRTYQSSATSEGNFWYQFLVVQRDSYLRMGKRLVALMVARSDPRLAAYFDSLPTGGYGGANPGQQLDPTVMSNLSGCGAGGVGGRCDPAFRQPLASHAETQLVIAEAAYQTGDATTALDSLNAERTAAGLPALVGITGTALLDSIMTEKYVVTFQNIEAWSDYKRECIPSLVPAAGAAQVIGRLPYSIDEVNTNPNVPSPEPARNANDPNACP